GIRATIYCMSTARHTCARCGGSWRARALRRRASLGASVQALERRTPASPPDALPPLSPARRVAALPLSRLCYTWDEFVMVRTMTGTLFPTDEEIDHLIVGPESLTWQFGSDLRLFLTMLYPLLLQVAHPTVGAG